MQVQASHKRIHLMILNCLLLGLLAQSLAQGSGYNEAPQLAQLVTAGQLPPVEERLPDNPMVVPVVERIGQYGGDWREYISGPSERYKIQRAFAYEHLVHWNANFSEVVPNVAESWDISEDARHYTFSLRQGIKWSDGAPFTADDIVFAYNDLLNNEVLFPTGPPTWLTTAGEPAVIEKLDDYTVSFTFSEPNGLFLQRIAVAGGHVLTHFPRHYLEQFHIDYNPDGIDGLIREAGVNEWHELFQQKRWTSDFGDNPDAPVLHGWKLVTPFSGGTSRLVFDRNPYYWKVDPEGNQLPYIDRMIFEIIQDVEITAIRMIGGELDTLLLGDDAAAVLANKAIFTENMERGGYRIVPVAIPGPFRVIALNLTHQDPGKREVFANKDFRIGLSHAINRQEIIDLLHIGQGAPYQAAPDPASQYYDEEFAKQYTEYNVALANEHLDRVLPDKDAEGFRLGPDGQRLTVVFEMIARPDDVDLFEILVLHWAEVGIDAQIRTMDRSLRDTRLQANLPDGFTWGGAEGTLGDEILTPKWFIPVLGNSYYAVPWAEWFISNGDDGEEPPEEVKRQMALYRQAVATADPERQSELMREVLAIAKEQFYVIGATMRTGDYAIVKNNFRNVPETIFTGPGYFRVAPTNPVQYFIETSQ